MQCPPSSRVLTAGLLLVLNLSACTKAGTDPGPRAAPAAASAAAAAPVGSPGTVQLSPYSLQLPAVNPDGSAVVQRFGEAATRAITRTYKEDADDPSVLLALLDGVAHDPEVVDMAPAWQAPLASALARARTLQSLGPTLRALRTAMQGAFLDEHTHVYRNVDAAACHAAFPSPPTPESPLGSFVVTVEPVGTFPLAALAGFCVEARAAALKERHIPGKPASEPVARMVRRLYSHARLDGEVRRVAVLGPWQREGARYTLHAVVGLEHRGVDDFNSEPCTVATVSIVRRGLGSVPVITEVGDRAAILCNELRP